MPAEYNLKYYRGDDMTFIVIPKAADGSPLDLSSATPSFTVATGRGDNPPPVPGGVSTIACVASKIDGNTKIECTITQANGLSMKADTRYVYNVAITAGGRVTTYLTGNIDVTERVVAP